VQLALQFWCSRSLTAVLAVWRARTQHNQDLDDRRRAVLARLRSLSLAASFSRWIEYSSLSIGKREVMRQAVARIAHGALHRSFGAWCDWTASAAERRAAAERCCQRMLNRTLFSAFSSWCESMKLCAAPADRACLTLLPQVRVRGPHGCAARCA